LGLALRTPAARVSRAAHVISGQQAFGALGSAGPVSDTSGPSTCGFVVKSVGLVVTAALAAGAGPRALTLPFTSILARSA
jgi:hypothetical protein